MSPAAPNAARYTRAMLFLAIGCTAPAILIDDDGPATGTGWVDEVPLGDDPDDPEPFDPTPWQGASFRIVEPTSGSLVRLGEPTVFRAELIGADGNPLDADRITWTSSIDATWDGLGEQFEDDALAPGLHELTAIAELPTGDVFAHTIGGVRVQHELAGTYSGLFSATGTYQQLSFTCAGSANLAIDARGEVARGAGNCLASLVIFDLPLDFEFDLQVDPATGLVDGQAGAVLLFGIVYDFPTSGTATPDAIELTWGGNVPFIDFGVDASLNAERVSLEPL